MTFHSDVADEMFEFDGRAPMRVLAPSTAPRSSKARHDWTERGHDVVRAAVTLFCAILSL
jgi:hypothetical protein